MLRDFDLGRSSGTRLQRTVAVALASGVGTTLSGKKIERADDGFASLGRGDDGIKLTLSHGKIGIDGFLGIVLN